MKRKVILETHRLVRAVEDGPDEPLDALLNDGWHIVSDTVAQGEIEGDIVGLLAITLLQRNRHVAPETELIEEIDQLNHRRNRLPEGSPAYEGVDRKMLALEAKVRRMLTPDVDPTLEPVITLVIPPAG